MKTVVEVRNRYVIGIAVAQPSGKLEVGVRQPESLPELKANFWLGNRWRTRALLSRQTVSR